MVEEKQDKGWKCTQEEKWWKENEEESRKEQKNAVQFEIGQDREWLIKLISVI